MSFSEAQIQALAAPLSAGSVKKNPRGFDYVEAWHAIAEANRIFGFDRWDRETVELVLLGEPRLVDGKSRVAYRAKVKITAYSPDGDPTVREGCGFGSGIDKDVDQAHESALKEAESDAMKRALMTFGNPFGLALYDKAKANVEPAPRADGGRQQIAAPKPALPAPKPTLAQRAATFEASLRDVATDPVKLERTFRLGASLCADLDRLDPERLAEITTLYERLQETPVEVFA